MKKLLLVVVLAVCCRSSAAYSAVSEDMSVYVRQDVFDAKMEALFLRLDSKIDSLRSEIKGEIKALSEKVDGLDKSLTEKIDGVNNTLSRRIDGLDSRISDLRNGFYLVSVLFGILLGLPYYNQWQEERKEAKRKAFTPSFTLEDIKKLIEENNVRMGLKPQI